MQARPSPPATSYLDLRQLAAYWSPERLNHHTAPTSLIYGLHAALSHLLRGGVDESVARHQAVGRALHEGLAHLGFEVSGTPPYALAHLATDLDEAALRDRLLQRHGIFVRLVGPHTWQIGLLGADATLPNARRLLLALKDVNGTS
jgi:alanine-glyoxylate transaminase/serine-glyoxylate transaminase/serine-pyruvate transaminase